MTTRIAPPAHRLSKDAVKVWIISDTILNIIGFIILGILFYLDHRYDWYPWVQWVLIGITILSIPLTIWSWIKPFLLYKNWRYGVDEEYLQLKSGAWKEIHQLVPMTKVQSVSTVQGPLLRKYGLCSISVETMGSSHSIPALPKEVAVALRNQIAQYAKVDEVEQ
ncbi:PH domain-containing protein [Paenibacillus sp. 1001270B_150601_E10]|uniref:PH domain-containing protein n=1 Tax=Paenibacillus sp. 1001270B_150601_E10 TaxID=2787079 RepID=UPI00189F457F|nr:PH domain-containing protein [Paenibacillus sp. 1001270B_150601_E10]